MSFYKIRPRSGTKAQWETANTILGEREIGYELPDGGVGTGAVKMKMGDGVTAWNDLPYAIPIGLTPDDIVQDATTDSSVKVPSAKVAKDIQDQVDVLNSNLNNNFDSQIVIALDTPYSCPSDGIVLYGGYFNAIVELTINNTTVGRVYGGGQSNASIFNSYKVKKGDVICIKTHSDNVIYTNIHSFAPYK